MFRRLWFVLPFFLISCNDSPPGPPPVSSVQITVEDVSCTEAWLKISLTDANQPRTVALRRDGQTVLTAQLTANDSLLIDEGLLPNRAYTYQAVRMRDSVAVAASGNAQLTTLDTNSHNWSFVLDTLGDGNSSALYDVAIINDTLAYAVGEMYLRDSTGQIDPQAWNAAKWNGQVWELKRIPFIGPCSAVLYPPLKAIWAFSKNNILVTNGGSIVRYDGVNATMDCGMNSLLAGAINKIYGASSQDVYVVGNVGTIVHYANGTWQRVESGTTLHVYDVFGVGGQGAEVYAVAAEQFVSFDKKILRITESAVVAVSDSAIPYSIHGVWFKPGRKYYVVGSGMYSKDLINSDGPWEWLHPSVTQYYLYAIRGNGLNDIFSCGSFGELIHYNGSSWRSFRTVTGISQGALYEVAIRGNVCIAVGYDSPRAIAIVGRR